MAVSWQWIFAIIGLVAFLMAVQPFTQFIWGRPKIEIEFNARDTGTSRQLELSLYNRPIKSRALKSIKVHRETAEDIFVVCNIENTQTHKVYTERLIPKIDTIHKEEYSVSMPSSTTPAKIYLIAAFDNGSVIIKDQNIALIPGKYCLTVSVYCSEIIVKKRVHFSVGTKPYELCWDVISSS